MSYTSLKIIPKFSFNPLNTVMSQWKENPISVLAVDFNATKNLSKAAFVIVCTSIMKVCAAIAS